MIDLQTGELLTGPAARRCLVSRSLPDAYDPDATHEAVDKLLAHLKDDEREWLLSALGHALRGRPNRREYLIVGEGGGGKSTLLMAIADALDEHAGFIAIGAIAARKYSGGPEPELEAFTNRRLMFYSEPPADLDYKRGKNQSGGDVVTFRRLFESESIEKRTTATRFFACNPDDVPALPWASKAVFDRVRTLPYPALPESERDLTLPERLNTKAARQALAALLVRYAVANPAPPADIPSVTAMREELRSEGGGRCRRVAANCLDAGPERSVNHAVLGSGPHRFGRLGRWPCLGTHSAEVYRVRPPGAELAAAATSPIGAGYETATRLGGLAAGERRRTAGPF